jgi:hypothetical protein
MLEQGHNSIQVFVWRVLVKIEGLITLHNLAELLIKMRPPVDSPVNDRAYEGPYQQHYQAIWYNNSLELLAMFFLMAWESRALLLIAWGATEASKCSINKALKDSAPFSSHISLWLIAISWLQKVRGGFCIECHLLIAKERMPLKQALKGGPQVDSDVVENGRSG